MLIAFDLDDTLIPSAGAFSTEAPADLRRFAPGEALRAKTPATLRELLRRGHTLAVYTSSDRQPSSVWFNFWRYGVPLRRIVNRRVHDDWLRSLPRTERDRVRYPVKYPPAFGFDLLVDDALAIAEAGQRHGFDVLRVDPADEDWDLRVLDFVQSRAR
jgi:hypothetical protein